MPKKALGIELRFRGHFRTGDAEALLQVLFIADEHIDVFHDPVDDGDGVVRPAEDLP